MSWTYAEDCPFQAGDRVRHKTLGLGTVDGLPLPIVLAAHAKDGPAWNVPIRWDNTRMPSFLVAGWALQKMIRPLS